MFYPALFSSLILFFYAFSTSAGQCFSVKDGVWSDSSVWAGGRLPAFSDTIIVSHQVFFGNDIEILPAGFLQIRGNASLCGLHALKVSCGASFMNEGTLKAKNAVLDGGGENNGDIFIAEFLQINSCGDIFSFGAMTVGLGYDCGAPGPNIVLPPAGIPPEISDTSSAATADSLSEKMSISVFPNPVSDVIEVKYSLIESCRVSVSLYDSRGKLAAVFFDQGQKEGISGHNFPLKHLNLATGIYFIRIAAGETTCCRKVLKDE